MIWQPDDMYRWGDICDDAIRNAEGLESTNVGAVLQHLGKALICFTAIADKTYAAQRAVPHLAEALMAARNLRELGKRSA